MTDFKNEYGGVIYQMLVALKKRDDESYLAWVAQSELEFPSRDSAGNYVPRSYYQHAPSEELEQLRQRHLKIHGALSDLRRFCLDCGLRIKNEPQ